MIPLEKLSLVLQASIAPVAFISGTGLLLLCMTNRYGRIVDRVRTLNNELESPKDKSGLLQETRLLKRRSRYVQWAILCISLSILSISFLIFFLFLGHYFNWPLILPIVILFSLALLFLCTSVALFTRDVILSLQLFDLELPDDKPRQP